MTCPRCGKANESEARFCTRCGIEMATVAAPSADADAQPCYRHRREMTLLRCGKCDRPICYRCVRQGASGPRCPECARQDIPFSARGFFHNVQARLAGTFRGQPYLIYLAFLVLLSVGGVVRGCASQRSAPPSAPSAPLPDAPVPD